jgi:hypothetical protein
MGAMLLDIKYPPKVLARTTHPILEPVAWYENEGLKAGVAYPCGAVILKDQLFVYYGGADMVVCVATAKMNEFMSQLSYEHEPMRTSVPMTPAQVSVPVNPVVNVPVKVQEHIYGYCVKCRAKAEIKNSHHVIIKNRRHAIQGICPRCGSKMFRFRNS